MTALALGIALRWIVMLGYRPALLFFDSFNYLRVGHDFKLTAVRPAGYPMFLWPIEHLTDSIVSIVVLQHLAGLGLAVACYVFLQRRGLPAWGATLAVLPLLLDPLQLVLEHYILSDVLFEVLLVAACLVLLWNRRPGFPAVIGCGVLLAGAALVRGAGGFLPVVFVVALVCLRPSVVKVAAFLLAAGVPLAAYAVAFHGQYGEFGLSVSGPRFLYARLAPIVHCDGLALPRHEQSLCPSGRPGERPSSNWFRWGGHQSAQFHLDPPTGMTQVQVIKDFDKRVIRDQPGVYAGAVAQDFVRGFAPSRSSDVPGFPAKYWLFDDSYWPLDVFSESTRHTASAFEPHADPGAAKVMSTYRRWVHLPGPVAAVLLCAAVAAALGVGRARSSGDRVAIGVLAASCALTLLTGAAVSGFSWRYQLPQIPLLPMAGALALAALWRGRAQAAPEPDEPFRTVDRLAHLVARALQPRLGRKGVERVMAGAVLEGALAVLLGVGVGVVLVAAAVLSGWATPATAAVAGVVAAALTTLALLSARRLTDREHDAASRAAHAGVEE